MKRLFLAFIALLTLLACSNDAPKLGYTVGPPPVVYHDNGNGSGNAATGYTYMLPLGGGQDDWPRLIGALNAGDVRMGPGTWNVKSSQAITRNGATLYGDPGASIVSTLSGSTAPFYAQGTIGAAITLSADATEGAVAITTATSVAAKSTLLLRSSDGLIAQMVITGTPSGGGPFTIPLDRALQWTFPSATAQLNVWAPVTGLRIIGNGMRMSGGGESAVFFNGCYRCSAEGLNVDASGLTEGIGSYALLIDTGSSEAAFRDCTVDGSPAYGAFAAASDRVIFDNVRVSNSGKSAFEFDSCANVDMIKCHGTKSTQAGLRLSNASATFPSTGGSKNVRVRGGSFDGNTLYGVWVTNASRATFLSDIQCQGNTQAGIFLDATTAAPSEVMIERASLQFNGTYGLNYSGSGIKGVSGVNLDVSNNGLVGLSIADDSQWSNIVFRGSAIAGSGNVPINVTGGDVTLRGLDLKSSHEDVNDNLLRLQNATKVSVIGMRGLMDQASTSVKAITLASTAQAYFEDTRVGGANAGTRVTAFSYFVNTTALKIGPSVDLSANNLQYSVNNTGTPIDFITGDKFKFAAAASLTTNVAQSVPSGSGATSSSSDLTMGAIATQSGFISRLQYAFTGSASNVAGQTISLQVYRGTGGGAPALLANASVTGIASTAGTKTGSLYFSPVSVATGDVILFVITPSAALTAALTDVIGGVSLLDPPANDNASTPEYERPDDGGSSRAA